MTKTTAKFSFLKNPYLVALVVTVIACVWLRLKFFMIESMWPDEALYAWNGVKISSDPSSLFTKQLWEFHPPGFSILIALFNVIVDYDIALRLVSPAFAVAGVVLIYFLGKELRSEFVGLSSAIMLCFNHLYWFISNRILLDVPLTTLCLAVVYAEVKYTKSKQKKWLLLSLLSLLSVLMIKTEGILMVGFTVLFVIRYYAKEIRRKYSNLKWIVAGIITGVALVVVLSRLNLHDTFRISAENLASASRLDFGYVLSWPFFVLFLVGLIFALLRRTAAYWILMLYLVAILVPKIVIGHTFVPRYMLPALPSMLIIAAMGAEDVLMMIRGWGLKINQWIIVGTICLLCIPSYTEGKRLHIERQIGYTGFEEAGELIKETNADLTYAMSMRAIRYYSNIEYEKYGGKLLPFPSDRAAFQKAIKGKSVVIEVDIFEYSAPAYVYPLTQANIRFFGAQGFYVKGRVDRPIPGKNGMRNAGVIYVLEKR